MEECEKLVELRKALGTELEDWGTRHLRSRKKEKWDVGVEREREQEEGEKTEKLASFFGTIYEFLSDFKSFEAMNLWGEMMA